MQASMSELPVLLLPMCTGGLAVKPRGIVASVKPLQRALTRYDSDVLTASTLMLNPRVLPPLTAGLSQLTVVRVRHVVRTANRRKTRRTLDGALTLAFTAFRYDTYRTPGAIRLLTGF